MRKLRLIIIALIAAGIGFTAVQPVHATHGNEYNPQNNDVIEQRDGTAYADILTAWADPPNYLDPCIIGVTNNTGSTYRYHPYVWKRSNDTEIWNGSIETLGSSDEFAWTTAGIGNMIVADIADVHEPYIKIVVSTTGGGYITTYTMDPYSSLAGKDHFEYEYESSSWSPC